MPTAPADSSSAPASTARIGLLHGAGYVGGELLRLLARHPSATLHTVTSRTFAGEPLSAAHPSLAGQDAPRFVAPDEANLHALDGLLIAGEHGQSMKTVPDLLADGLDGPIVDLSADFRLPDPALYSDWYDVTHPAPALLRTAVYGLPEWTDALPESPLIANPGCYATGIALALAPLAQHEVPFTAHVTALTGASGSGALPSAATHFPDRAGNVRPYKVLAHQHEPEVLQTLGPHVSLQFVPASGPWTRGIWGTAQVEWATPVPATTLAEWYEDAYAHAPCVRLRDGVPSLKPTIHTPFCDLGWTTDGDALVVGFALDNLLKGAASQALQSLNRALGVPETAGLLVSPSVSSLP